MAASKFPRRFNPDFSSPNEKPNGDVQLSDNITDGIKDFFLLNEYGGSPSSLLQIENAINNGVWTPGDGILATNSSANSYIKLSDNYYNNLFAGSPAVTFVATFTFKEINSTTDFNTIVGTKISGSNAMLCQVTSSGTVTFGGRSTNSDGFQSGTSTKTLVIDTKYTIVGVLNYTGDEIMLWVNGEEYINVSVSFSANTYNAGNSTNDCGVGGQELSDRRADLLIESFSFYGRVLTQSEAVSLWLDPYQVLDPVAPLRRQAAEAATGNTITANQAEAGDSQSATLQAIINITSDQDEAGDSQAALIQVPANVAAVQSEAGDTQAASILAIASVSASQSEAGDTQSASIQSIAGIAADVAEAGDTQAATIEALIAITANQSEAGDTQTADLNVLVKISAAQSEAGDTQTAAIVGVVTSTITANQPEAGDVQTAALEVQVAITSNQAEAGDSQSASISNVASINATQSEAGDAQAASITTVITGTITANQNEAGDTQVATLDNVVSINANQPEAGDAQSADIENIVIISAAQNEAGDTQSAAIVHQLFANIAANQDEAGDVTVARIATQEVIRTVAITLRSPINDTITLRSPINDIITVRSKLA